MATDKKGITVKVDADLHAEIREYLAAHQMTMAEFISLAVEDELHPKYQEKEENTMEKMRTLAFQVPEDLFQRIKDYLHRNNMTQKEFVIGLIENEIDRDLTERETQDNTEEEAVEDDVYDGEELEGDYDEDDEILDTENETLTEDEDETLTDTYEDVEETDDTELVDDEAEEDESELTEDDFNEEETEDSDEDFEDEESEDLEEDDEYTEDEEESSGMGMEMSM